LLSAIMVGSGLREIRSQDQEPVHCILYTVYRALFILLAFFDRCELHFGESSQARESETPGLADMLTC
jgi:hypothetical protein